MSKSNEDTKSKLLDHNYDGIQELDNKLPNWWLILFYVTIGFGAIYFGYYQLAGGPSLKDEFRAEVSQIEASKTAAGGGLAAFPDAAKAAAAEKSVDQIAVGKAVFAVRCVSCHGDKGQGNIGPNLTDNFWLHGDGKIVDIAKVIHDGVADKGMPAWGTLLSENDVYSVAAFVRSLRGTNPAGAKAPQGQEYKE